MRFTLSSTVLSSKLSVLAKVINTKNTLSILDCFLFDIHDEKLTISASDNANVVRLSVELIDCDGEATFCIPNRILLASIKELPEQPLTFDVNTNDNSIRMVYQNGVYNIVGQSASEYPIPNDNSTEEYSVANIATNVLADGLQRTIFATANDELRQIMNGICFDFTEQGLNMVASDGHKMVRNIVFDCKTATPTSFILPKKPATLLRSMLSNDSEEMASISFNSHSAIIEFPEGQLRCALIEGRYPRYNTVIPKDNPNLINVDRKALISAVRRVLPFASESTQLIKLRMTMNNIEVSSNDIDFATSANEDVVCDYDNTPMSIGFKGPILLEVLNNIETDNILIALADPSRAGVIRPTEQPEGIDILMLIMPMLLGEM